MAKALITPKGTAIYPRLTKADTEYDPDGTFHVKMRFDTDLPEVAKFVEQIDYWYDEAFDEAVAKAVEAGDYKTEAVAKKKIKRGDKPYKFVEDDEGDDTNEIVINFKMKAQAKNRKTGEMFALKCAIYGGEGRLQGDDIPLIYTGSILKVGYTPIKWYTKQLGASVKLRLEAAKIIELVSGSGGGDVDFGDDEEGYVPPAKTEGHFDGDDDGADGGDDGDF